MDTLLQIGLSNAVVATGLALVVACVGLVWKRPALRHSLWLLVLLKMLTPPLVWVPVPWPQKAAEPDPVTAAPAPHPESTFAPAALVEPVAGPLEFAEIGGGAEEPRIVARVAADADPETTLSSPDAQPAAPLPFPRWWPDWWQTAVISIWLTGSAVWFTCAIRRLARFQRLLRHARLAPVQLQKQAQRLARKLGMTGAPTVYLVPGRLSPLLWACFGSPRLVLPGALLEHIDDEQRATLILHELAHLRRRDHWVRALEFLAMGLYWWNPVVWFARRELREAEELCCDAWVVSSLPQANRTYATALVETIEFLSAAPAQVPLLASGIGPISDLNRRLTMIMRGTTPRKLGWHGVLVVLGLAAFLLPLLPAFAQAQDNKEQPDNANAEARLRYVELLNDYEQQVAAGADEAEMQKLQSQLEQKLHELRETELKMREIREKLRQIEGGKLAVLGTKDMKETYRLLLHSAQGAEPQEIILRKADGKWQIVDPKTVKLETLRTITVPMADGARRSIQLGAPVEARDGKKATQPTGGDWAKPAAANPDARITELERKVEKVLQLMEQLRKDMQSRQPVLDRGFFPQDGPVAPPVIDRGFGPADESGRDRFRKPATPTPVVPGGKPLQP